MQGKRASVAEAIANVVLGYVIAVLAQILLFPLFGIYISLQDDLLLGLCFTAISLVRLYVLRRLFNRREKC